MAKTVIALYDDLRDAHSAVEDLRTSNHFTNQDITLMAHDANNRYSRYLEDQDVDVEETKSKTEADTGAATGAGIGAVVGGIAGFLVGAGVLFIPGLGPVVAAGPLAATLLGVAGGAAAGGIVGALIGLGIPDKDAHRYAEGLRRGGTIVVVRADDQFADDAADILGDHNPVDIEKRAGLWREEGWSGKFEPAEEVYTTDRIKEERAEYPSTTRSTAYTYSYEPTTDTARENGSSMDDSKSRVNRSGRTEHTGDIYARHENDFRTHFETHPQNGNNFDEVSDAYRTGARLGRRERLAREDWNKVRAEAHKQWAENHRNEPFEKVEDYVKYGWYKTKEELWDVSTPRR